MISNVYMYTCMYMYVLSLAILATNTIITKISTININFSDH